MNLRLGFYRITIVVSVVAGLIVAGVFPKEPFIQFNYRPATTAERAAAEKWFRDFNEKHPQRLPSPSALNGLTWTPADLSEEENRDFNEDMWTALLGHIATKYQPRTPIEFVFRFYVLPFFLGFFGTWLIYVVLRFLIIGYIVQGFRRTS